MTQTSVDEVFRDFNTPGNPASGDYKPEKPRIRALLKQIMNQSGQAVTRNTYAALSGVTPPTENYMGVVLNDPDPSKNGYYSRVAGVWTFGRGFPDSFTVFEQTGGTANALQLTAAAGVNPGDVVAGLLVPTASNTGATTIAINGDAAVPLLSAAGSPLAAGELVAGKATIIARVAGGWRVILAFSQFSFRKAWDSATTYVADDIVESGGSLWLALTSNTNVTPTEGVDWTLFLPGVTVADGSVGRPKIAAALSKSIMPSVFEFGAVGDGTTDDAAAIDAAQALGPLYFTPGEYRIAADLELTACATFEEGAQITVSDGVTLTLSGEIMAGAYKIFEVEGAGEIVVSATSKLSKIEGSWFDHAYTNNSTTVRGVLAGHAAVGSNGLNGLGYALIDGYRAAEQTTVGLEATIIGTFAGNGGLDHTFNTLIGYSAGRGKETPSGSGIFRTWTGNNNVAVGFGAMQNPLTADNNVVVGGGASLENESPNAQVVIGASACRIGTVGKESVVIGSGAAYSKGTTGDADANTRCVHIGYIAAQAATEGIHNTSLGSNSAANIVTGNDNTHIGYLTGVDNTSSPAASRQIALGSVARSRVDDSITIGTSLLETTAGRIRIGGASQTSAVIAGVYGSTTADAANVVVNSSGQLLRSTSSAEFKRDIEPLTDEWADKVLNLEPVYYRSKCAGDNPDWGWYGLIAEDAAKVDPRFATWSRKPVRDKAGNLVPDEFGNPALEDEPTPNGVPYERLVVSLLAVVKRHEAVIKNIH